MKVLHIATTLDGGAGLCALRIISATRAMGVDTRAIVACGEKSEYVDVVKPVDPFSRFKPLRYLQILLKMKGVWPKAAKITRRIAIEKGKNGAPVTFTSPVTLYTSMADHPWVKEADIIHLHWVGEFLDYESFFNCIKKPIVWTLHDQNPGLGGFHYQFWKERSTECFRSFDDELVQLKEKAFGHIRMMTVVGISSIMKGWIEHNELLRRFPCTLIYNGIEADKFIPVQKDVARKALGLSENDKVFLFVAQYIHQDIKGLNELIAALEILKIPNGILVCVGGYSFVPKASFEIRCEGFVGNNRLQSLYYSAADYFISPSYWESFAQTPIEAMACGVPAVLFPCCGAKDLITEENGVVCKNLTVEALAEGIRLAMSKTYDLERVRASVVTRLSYDKIARQYVDLYESVLN